MDELVETYLLNIPLFSDVPLDEINIRPLAGLSNQNFLLSINNSHYVLRIPRESTNAVINRDSEAFNEEIAYDLGLTPQVLWREENTKKKLTGTRLSIYLKNHTVPTCKNSLDVSILAEIAKSLKNLHNSDIRFKGIIDNSTITEYLKHYFCLCSREQQSQLRHDYKTALTLLPIINDQELTSYPLVPSHVDLVLDNILLPNNMKNNMKNHAHKDSRKIWLIDWEYSAMASPFWDIATLSNAAGLCDQTAVSFMKKVLTDNHSNDIDMLKKYRCLVKTVSDCWHTAYRTIPMRSKQSY